MTYFLERNGKINYEEIRIKLKDMLYLFKEVYLYYSKKDYFKLAFEGDNSSSCLMIPSPYAYFFAHTGSAKIYPIEEHYHRYDKDTLFTVMEVLHRYIRKYEYGIGMKTPAQKEFRDEINKFLRFFEEGYELNEKGWISQTTMYGLRNLLNENLPEFTSDKITLQVETAIKMFFHYSTNEEQKKKAINILADILEPLREDLKTLTMKEHDKMIFGIVNTCSIRHNNDKQYEDYNKEIWYEWMFHYYLATIHACIRLKKVEV